MDWLGMRAFFIAGTCLFWSWYVFYRYINDHKIIKYWGFQKRNFFDSWKILFPFMSISLCFILIFAMNNDIEIRNKHIIPVLLLYPLWGLIQQFIFLGIIFLNLNNSKFFQGHKNLIFILVAAVFSIIHYPHLIIMVFTFLMEIVFLITYFKWRNLWAIGLTHGWVATFLLYFIIKRDLWVELFAWFKY
jgi:hypothetical protein